MVEALPVLSGLGWERKLGTQALNVHSADFMDLRNLPRTFTKSQRLVSNIDLEMSDLQSSQFTDLGETEPRLKEWAPPSNGQ